MSETHDEKRSKLEEERSHLLRRIDELTVGGEVDMEYDDDFADRGQVAGEIGANLTLAEALRTQLARVDKALERIEKGGYGLCTACGNPIEAERLEALPMASTCIAHA